MTSFTNTTTNYPQGANTPIKRVKFEGPPTKTIGYNLGDEYLDTSNDSISGHGIWYKLTTVDTGGVEWVPMGTGFLDTLTGNSGGPVGPDRNGNINTLGTGSITILGNPATFTETTELTGLTNHNVLVGAGTPTITKVAPSATSGVPLVSAGSAADPIFGTATVPGGGTGDTSFTAFAVITGGTTSTGALQNVSGLGNALQVLTSNGPGTLPTWQDNSAQDLHVARFIVSAGGLASGANYTTITSATAAALSGDTIFICEGTYNENLTLKPGITYMSFNFSGQNPGIPADVGNVIIHGRCDLSVAGIVKFIGITLETSNDYALSITGSALSFIDLLSCFIHGLNANGILSNSSNPLSQISVFDSNIYIPPSGQVPIQVATSRISIENSLIRSDATQSSTVVNGFLGLSDVDIIGIIDVSGSGVLDFEYVSANTNNVDSFIKKSGTGTCIVEFSSIDSGTFSCISVGAGCTLETTFSNYTSNAASGFFISGSGIVNYGSLVAKGTAVAFAGTLTANMYTEL